MFRQRLGRAERRLGSSSSSGSRVRCARIHGRPLHAEDVQLLSGHPCRWHAGDSRDSCGAAIPHPLSPALAGLPLPSRVELGPVVEGPPHRLVAEALLKQHRLRSTAQARFYASATVTTPTGQALSFTAGECLGGWAACWMAGLRRPREFSSC